MTTERHGKITEDKTKKRKTDSHRGTPRTKGAEDKEITKKTKYKKIKLKIIVFTLCVLRGFV